jgi:hypothetical protein
MTNGADGFVSIEVSPGAANNAEATISEGTRLWATVGRPNVMIKVPGTVEGAKAVRQLIANGVNVNITLLFAIAAHKSVIEAYMSGLEDRIALGKTISTIHSVASFFVSRVDSEVDKRLDVAGKGGSIDQETLKSLVGKAAIANAKLAYRLFQEQVATPRWRRSRGRERMCSGRCGPARAQRIGVPRRHVRRTVDWPRHREHDAAADARSVPRSRVVKRTVDAGLDESSGSCARSKSGGSRCVTSRTSCSLTDSRVFRSPSIRSLLDCKRRRRRWAGSWSRADRILRVILRSERTKDLSDSRGILRFARDEAIPTHTNHVANLSNEDRLHVGPVQLVG